MIQDEEVDTSSDVEMGQAEGVQPQQSRHRTLRNRKRSRDEFSDNETGTRPVRRRKSTKLDSAEARQEPRGRSRRPNL